MKSSTWGVSTEDERTVVYKGAESRGASTSKDTRGGTLLRKWLGV